MALPIKGDSTKKVERIKSNSLACEMTFTEEDVVTIDFFPPWQGASIVGYQQFFSDCSSSMHTFAAFSDNKGSRSLATI